MTAADVSVLLLQGNFVLLAGAGNLALAAGKGMGKPCFRIIQTHFSQNRANVGDVAAKEEVRTCCHHTFRSRSFMSLGTCCSRSVVIYTLARMRLCCC